MSWSEFLNPSNGIALCAMLYTIVGVHQSQKLARRNEDKMLVDSLVQMLSEMEAISSKFFLSNKEERVDIHYYSACFLTKLNVAINIARILQEKRSVLSDSIYTPLSTFHWHATVNIESIYTRKIEQNLEQYRSINQAYLNSITKIYDSFEKHYESLNVFSTIKRYLHI